MVENDKKIAHRMYLFAVVIFIMAVAVVVKMTNIQLVEGDYYRKLAKERTVKRFVIPANKGNIYSVDGSLLATSIPNYDIRFDAVAPKQEDFDKNLGALAEAMSEMFGKPAAHYENALTHARDHKNRYFLIAKGLSYTEYMRVKAFPLFNKGPYKGGFIMDQKTVREYPIGQVALRTIGYDRIGGDGKRMSKGIEAAFANYLNGTDGKILKQKIAKGQWKPIRDENEVEPHDGYDVISTIDVYIQDIAHHALLKQLQEYQADHGCVVVMETKTGEIRAISNLGRAKDSTYYETVNYAIAESHEPGSTFKLVDMLALLDDKRADTSDVYNRHGGEIQYGGGHWVKDSHYSGAEPTVSLARGFEISSNTVLVQAVYNNYRKDPQTFVDRINRYGLNKPLGLPFEGEGKPVIPQPGDARWSAISLPWMAFGYGVSVTPLQTLSLYNAVANNGEMVKPIFVREIKEWNKTIKKFDKQVICPKIASDETLKKIRAVLGNVVKKGTGKALYSPNFSMAGKTGTAQVDYYKGEGKLYYASSFVGYFPADNPKYSCIVVVHKPSTAKGYYGADVAGPVFKRIAQKIFTDSPSMNEVKNLKQRNPRQDKDFERYDAQVVSGRKTIPNLKGMAGMDAVALLENLGMRVRVIGVGKVRKQSLNPGQTIEKNTTITLELS